MKRERPLLIKNIRIIDPGREIDGIGSVFIDRYGMIRMESSISEVDCDVLDGTGLVVSPGFIDLHCHLREPGYEQKETIFTGMDAAAKGGFTTICCMPNTSPALDSVDIIRSIVNLAERREHLRVLPIGCVTENRKGLKIAPLEEMTGAMMAGFSDDGSPVFDADIMRQALMICRDKNIMISEHCEVPELAGDGCINEGAVSNQLGVKGIPDAAEEDMVERDIELAKETGGWVHIAHASTRGSVDLIRKGKAEGVSVTAEVTPHHLTLTEDEVLTRGGQAKVNPPLRTQDDIDALIEGLNDGTIDAIATDHAPHTEQDKQGDLYQAAFGFTGFETALGSLMSLVHDDKISLNLVISKLTAEPARILDHRYGISGIIGDNQPADLTIFDPHAEWTVDPSTFKSKGKNTPLAGKTLRGKVLATFSRGCLVYCDDGFKIPGDDQE